MQGEGWNFISGSRGKWKETGMKHLYKEKEKAECWRLTPVILATWEAGMRKISVPGQPTQIVLR
jgi:hypothetical protein